MPAPLAQETPEGAGAIVRRSIGTPELRNLTPFLMLDKCVQFFAWARWSGDGFALLLTSAPAPLAPASSPRRALDSQTIRTGECRQCRMYLKVRCPTQRFQERQLTGLCALPGEFDHEDVKGHKGRLAAGDVQFMIAGRGIMHSEMPVHGPGKKDPYGLQLCVLSSLRRPSRPDAACSPSVPPHSGGSTSRKSTRWSKRRTKSAKPPRSARRTPPRTSRSRSSAARRRARPRRASSRATCARSEGAGSSTS